MSDVVITWDTRSKGKVAPRRGSPNKSKSAKRAKRITPEKYRETITHEIFERVSHYTTDSFGDAANAVLERAKAQAADAELDADVEALFLLLYNEYKDSAWKKIAKTLMQAAPAAFMLDVLARLKPTRDLMYEEADSDRYVPNWRIYDKALIMLPTVRKETNLAKDDEYDEALARARELWEGTDDLLMKLQLAYIFPLKTAWGDAVVDAWPAYRSEEAENLGNYGDITALLYATGASIDKKKEIADKLFAPDPNSTSSYFWFGNSSNTWHAAFECVDVDGAASVEVLAELYTREWSSAPEKVAAAMALIEAPEIAEAFAMKLPKWGSWARSRNKFQTDMQYLHDFPELALPAVERVAADSGKPEDYVELLTELRALAASDEHEAEHSELYVDRAELPRGLAMPPWRDPSVKKKRRKRPKIEAFADLEMLASEVISELGEGDAAAHDERAASWRGDQSEEELAGQLRDALTGYYWYWRQRHIWNRLSCDALRTMLEGLPPEKLNQLGTYEMRHHILAPLGESGRGILEAFLEHTTKKGDEIIDVLEHYASPAVVRHVASALTRSASRRKAVAWVRRYPRLTAIGAVHGWLTSPDAKTRNPYNTALCLAYAEDPEVVQAVIDAYDEQSTEDVAAALPELDVYMQYPAKMPKMPHFWTPHVWPEVRMKHDPSKLLPRELYEDIGFMLKFSEPGAPYVGLEELGEVADETSLAEFSWALFESWVDASAPTKEKWVIQAIAMYGGAEMADKLPMYIDRWYDSPYNKRAETTMYALQNVDNPYIIETLWRLIQGGFNWALGRARTHAKDITGITDVPDGMAAIEVIADAYIPTFGMDEHRILELAPGMDLEVWLDADLEPHLPTGTELDPTAELRWERLRALASRQNQFQALRLERAMKTKRRWGLAAWQEKVNEHPLLGLIARRILWASFDGKNRLVAVWRVDEENQALDLNDDPVDISVGPLVGIPLPSELSDEDRQAWSSVFGDYEVIQPFEQVERDVSLVNGEGIEELMRSLSGKATTLGAIQRACFVNRWHDKRNRKRDASVGLLRRPMRSKQGTDLFEVEITFYPGFRSGVVPNYAEAIQFGSASAKKKKAQSWSEVDPVELAELYHELDVLVHSLVPLDPAAPRHG